MNRFGRVFFGIVLLAALARAQVVPGRYIVELTEAPLGAAVRANGRAPLGTRQRVILAEQARARPLIERRRGRILSSVDSLMNALIVHIPDEEAAALTALPGVKRVYPVHEYQAVLDHALPLLQVPAAWARIGGQNKAGAGIKIGILDTGVSPNHPGFQDPSMLPPPGFPRASSTENLALTNNKIIVARSYEDIYQPTEHDNATDRNGHGTAVAMCAAGVTNKGTLGTITGVAPKAWIGGYKITSLNVGTASGDVILKAMDDALADGMDVINLSFGSPFVSRSGPDFLPGVAVERLRSFGVIMVVAAGNDGPSLNTMGDYSSLPSVISVGAVNNDRTFGGSVSVAGGPPYRAFAGSGTKPPTPISAKVFDITSVDSTGFACDPLPAGSATGQIALILRGVCTFETKLNSAQAGGALAVILYTDAARPDGVSPAVGAATLPAVLVSYADGAAIKAKVAADATATATVVFDGVSYPLNPHLLTSFTSRGPNYDFSIKPDLAAVGASIYTAAESVDDKGEIYSKDGYLLVDGTSFSAPLVTGAAAVLRSARPGMTVDQYRSLLINSASPFINGDGVYERVQQTGVGILNLDAALRNTIAVYPTSVTYGVGSGILGGAGTGDFDQFAVTNLSNRVETYQISAISYDTAPGLQFSAVPGDAAPTSTLSVMVAPGQTKTVYAYWTAVLAPGEWQGQIAVTGALTSALIPYWYGAPTLIPRNVFQLNPPPATASAGATVTLDVRVTDDIGYPITSDATLAFRGAATSGAAISLNSSIFYPNLRQIRLTLSSRPVANTFQFSIGKLAPVTIVITGTPPPNP